MVLIGRLARRSGDTDHQSAPERWMRLGSDVYVPHNADLGLAEACMRRGPTEADSVLESPTSVARVQQYADRMGQT